MEISSTKPKRYDCRLLKRPDISILDDQRASPTDSRKQIALAFYGSERRARTHRSARAYRPPLSNHASSQRPKVAGIVALQICPRQHPFPLAPRNEGFEVMARRSFSDALSQPRQRCRDRGRPQHRGHAVRRGRWFKDLNWPLSCRRVDHGFSNLDQPINQQLFRAVQRQIA